MKILAIETSCDETACAVTEGFEVISSVKITQEIHAMYGGVVPSLAKRDHEANIDFVINKALSEAKTTIEQIGAIAVTMGPGLAIALGVGIAKAKELAVKFNKPIIAVNHVEGHILSSLIDNKTQISFPCLALVISGGHTQLVLVKGFGEYKVLLESLDDDIGEALDKGARLIGLPYPGGPALENMAAKGNFKRFQLPLPMAGKEGGAFSYAGLKAAFSRLVKNVGEIDEQTRADLAACYQEKVFKHLIRTINICVQNLGMEVKDLLVGGGVAANNTLNKQLVEWGDENKIRIYYPSNKLWCTDNAAMIGVVGGIKAEKNQFSEINKVDRRARWRVDEAL